MSTIVTVHFATNRMPLTDESGTTIIGFGSELGPVDGTNIRFGSAQAEVEGTDAVFVPGSLSVADETLFGPEIRRGSRTIFEQLREDMKVGGRPTLIVIHGFSNSFENAIERAATILTFYGLDANVFAFTWPSVGSNLPIPLPYRDYFHDRGTARASGMALARTMRILYDFIDGLPKDQFCRQPLHLIAHSMGVFALRHGLQALLEIPVGEAREFASAIDEPPAGGRRTFPALFTVPTEGPDPNRLRRTFEQIVLAAGDEDEDAFENPRELQYLPRLARRVTVYHTHRDWVLATLSEKTKFNGPRLGVDGPENMAPISDKITAVDVSDGFDPNDDSQSHQYYRLFGAVRDDIVAVLRGERQDTISNRDTAGPGRYRLVKAAAAQRVRSRAASRRKP
ncbi:Alpha/beta fold hydrolase [Methylorubrum populi]